MARPSRRRRSLLALLPFPFPRLIRFILSHPRHVRRLRMWKRGRRISCSAPTENISKLEPGRSPVTTRRTCQTLTSSSNVESAPMSDKCDIQFDANPIQGASGGSGQVAQVPNFEATHGGSSSRPPLDLLNCPDEFKSLEMDRLVPCDLKNASPNALQQYGAYLHWFYYSHTVEVMLLLHPLLMLPPSPAASYIGLIAVTLAAALTGAVFVIVFGEGEQHEVLVGHCRRLE